MKHRIRTTCFLLLMFATLSAAAQEDHTTLNASLAATNVTSGKDIAAFFVNANGTDFIEAKAVGSKGGTRLVRLAAKAPFTRTYSTRRSSPTGPSPRSSSGTPTRRSSRTTTSKAATSSPPASSRGTGGTRSRCP